MKKIILSSFICFFFLGKISLAQVSFNLADSFQTCINNHIVNTADIGISSAIIMPNGGIWIGTAGDDGMGLPIQTNTPFYAASTSKTFISACFMQLIEAGTININAPIHQFLTSNKYPSAYIDSTITLDQLLNHTSGIYNYGDNPSYMNTMIANPTKVYHHGESLTLFLNQPPYFAKGTAFQYSNSNYTLLAMILEKITNMNLKDVISTRILTPLHLTTTFSSDSTTTNSTAGFWANTGTGGDLNLSGLSHTGLLTSSWGPGHMVTTPFDLASYCRALIKGQLYTNSSTITNMLTMSPFSTTAAGYGYGLGIERKKYAGNYLFGHTGNIGHITYMFHSPTDDYTIVTMTNRFAVNGSDNVLAFKALEKIILRHLNYPLNISNELSDFSFEVFPTPTEDRLVVSIPKMNNTTTVSITNLVGKEVLEQKLSELQNVIHVNHLQNGVYFVKLTQGNYSSSKKIVINH